MSSSEFLRLPAMLVLLALSCAIWAQPIYKTVDENGNVVYTDRKPDDNAQPMELPELSVVDPVDLGDVEAARAQPSSPPGSGTEAASVPGLRLLSPTNEQTFHNTGYVLPVQVAVDGELPPGSQLAYLVDGQVKQSGTALQVMLNEVYRGEHRVQVQLRAANGRVLASTAPVTIFMHQASAN